MQPTDSYSSRPLRGTRPSAPSLQARASLLDTLIRRKPIPQELKDGVTWSEVRTFIGRTTSEDQSNRPEAPTGGSISTAPCERNHLHGHRSHDVTCVPSARLLERWKGPELGSQIGRRALITLAGSPSQTAPKMS